MGKGSGTNTVTNNSQPPPQVLAAYQDAYNRAQTAANTYTNIGWQPQQWTASNEIDAAQGAAQPFIQAAQADYNAAATPSYQNVQNYENPYTQSVVNATQAQFN